MITREQIVEAFAAQAEQTPMPTKVFFLVDRTSRYTIEKHPCDFDAILDAVKGYILLPQSEWSTPSIPRFRVPLAPIVP